MARPVDTTTTTSGDSPATVVQPIADCTRFAFVTVGEDETGEMTLGGRSGRDAQWGGTPGGGDRGRTNLRGRRLAQRLYIDNDDQVLELIHVADDAQFLLISGDDTSDRVAIDSDSLAQVWEEGTYEGGPIYGVSPSTPIAMDVTIADGLVSGAEAFELTGAVNAGCPALTKGQS
ncbi:MAG TPA: hypothetical protein VMM14_07190 [Acidimicrobiia bacterium]|nr:hypothetical protein [Acidimicrobiia bacterium]